VIRFTVRTFALVGTLAGTLASVTQRAAAQVVSTAAGTPNQTQLEPASETLLSRRVSINVDRVPVEAAIRAAAMSAKLQIQYQLEIVDGIAQRVTLHVENVPLGAALTQILDGTGLHVISDGGNGLMIVADKGHGPAIQERGVVTGVVTNAATRQPLHGVTVLLDDTTRSVRTDDAGRYRLTGVSAGAHRVTVRYVGYARKTRPVTVSDGETVHLDFALDASVNSLDQVVVTATGAQRVRELGHIVAQINADSLVKAAPITDLSDLLQSRVPGLQVVSGSGSYAGETISLQLRGQSSMALNSAPIVIVDGVRYQSDNSMSNAANTQDIRGAYAGQQRSPLNDLNPNDIATIDVVKGPSASTLYGPDAANGVIVVTTKRGQVGAPQFRWYARPMTSDVPEPAYVTKSYTIWSHDPNTGALNPYPCTLANQYYYHVCVLDSITVGKSIVQIDSLSPIAKNRPTWQYGASLSGGSQMSRYFVSGNYSNQIGSLQIPPALQRLIANNQGANALPNGAPNSLMTLGMQTSISSEVSSWFSMDGTANITHVNNNRSAQPYFYANALSVGSQLNADSAGLEQYVANGGYPVSAALRVNTEESNRLVGSFSANVRPATWVSANVQVGTDLNYVQDHATLPGGLVRPSDGGGVEDDRRAGTGRNVSFMLNTTFHPSRFSFRTTGGVQYIYHRLDGTNASAYDLPAGSSNAYLAQQQQISPQWEESVQLGTFGEEVFGINDRIFLTGSLRVDGSTTYGDAYHPTPFPKLGASWIASEEPWLRNTPGLRELRFRYSYGSSTKHPTSSMKLGQLNAYNMNINSNVETAFWPQNFANPDLRPERSNEHEWGADATILNGMTLQLTWWNRNVIDELDQLQGQTVGLNYYWVNGATVAKHGFEATMTVPLFATRQAQGEVTLNYASNVSKVVHLPSGPSTGGGLLGYPIDAVFIRPVTGYADTAGGHADSVITAQEVVYGPYSYVGVLNPPRTFTVTPSLLLFNGVVRVSSLFDRTSGFVTQDDFEYQCQYNANCLAPFLRSTPLAVQALYASGSRDAFSVLTSYTRWRELSITASVPTAIMKKLNVFNFQLLSNASVSIQGRNLLLWSNFKGTDPESRSDRDPITSWLSDGIPQARSWSLRFDFTP